MRWRCHHPIGDPVRFLFVSTARLVDCELGLQPKRFFRLHSSHCPDIPAELPQAHLHWSTPSFDDGAPQEQADRPIARGAQ